MTLKMIALDNMQKRLQYGGGAQQQSRMIEDKLKSLKKALLYSYQAGTMIIHDAEGNSLEFRCLMNPDKITFDADKKMLSVPFKDVCLNLPRVGKMSEGIIDVPIACGDTFIWKETQTRWLVVLQYLEELAYFRADVRKCFPHPLYINDNPYWFASVGQNELTIDWHEKRNREIWNDLNFTRTLYLKRNEETLDYFKRFKKIKVPDIDGVMKTWEVQAYNPNATDDVLILHIKEYYENQFEEVSAEEQAKIQEENELLENRIAYVYSKFNTKEVPFVQDAVWEIKNKTDGLNIKLDAILDKEDNATAAIIQLMNGKTGEFDVYYNDSLVERVVVKSI